MFDALHSLDLEVGFFVAGETDIRKNQDCLRSIREVEGAIEAERLDATFLAAGFVEDVGEGHGFIVDLVGEMRWEYGNRQGNGRLDLHA